MLRGFLIGTIARLGVHEAPSLARQAVMAKRRLLCTCCQCLFVARKIVEHAIRDDGEVLREVEGGGDDEEREEQEKDRVYSRWCQRSPFASCWNSPGRGGYRGGHTEDELLGRSQHVE